MERELMIPMPSRSSCCYRLLKPDEKRMPVKREESGGGVFCKEAAASVLRDLTSELFLSEGVHTPGYRNLNSLFNSCEEQIGRKFNYCLLKAVSSSNYATPEQALMEIGRSTLLFVILIHALASEDLMVTSLVLNTAANLNLFDKRRSAPYLKDLLKTEFNLMPELCLQAYSYGMRINASGLLEIPAITLDVLKCFSEEQDGAGVQMEEAGADGASASKMEEGGAENSAS